jgi:hypothetical protein
MQRAGSAVGAARGVVGRQGEDWGKEPAMHSDGTIVVTSMEELHHAIQTAKNSLKSLAWQEGLSSDPEPEFWFRGLPNEDFRLGSSSSSTDQH